MAITVQRAINRLIEPVGLLEDTVDTLFAASDCSSARLADKPK